MSKKVVKGTQQRQECCSCGKDKPMGEYYISHSVLYRRNNGKTTICKQCIGDMIDENTEESTLKSLKQILILLDKPFLWDVFESSKENKVSPSVVKNYLKNIVMKQYSEMTYIDSVFENPEETSKRKREEVGKNVKINGDKIEITDDLVIKWGTGYAPQEYMRLEQFYNQMMETHDITTVNHKQMLIQMAKMTIKLDRLLEEGNVNDYSKLSKTYDDLSKASGFRPIDRKNGSDSMGLFSFGQVWAEIEKEGFILPDMIDYPEDDIDHMLLYYIQFVQRLTGRSLSSEPPENWREEVDDNGEL